MMKKLIVTAIIPFLLSGCILRVYSSKHPAKHREPKCTATQLCGPPDGNVGGGWVCVRSTEYTGYPPICKEDSKKKK